MSSDCSVCTDGEASGGLLGADSEREASNFSVRYPIGAGILSNIPNFELE